MEAQQLGKCVLSKLELGGEPHQAVETASAWVSTQVSIKWKLQWQLDVEKQMIGTRRSYTIMESDLPNEVNIYELWELNSQEERNQKIQGLLEYCTNRTEDFIQELVAGQAVGPV